MRVAVRPEARDLGPPLGAKAPRHRSRPRRTRRARRSPSSAPPASAGSASRAARSAPPRRRRSGSASPARCGFARGSRRRSAATRRGSAPRSASAAESNVAFLRASVAPATLPPVLRREGVRCREGHKQGIVAALAAIAAVGVIAGTAGAATVRTAGGLEFEVNEYVSDTVRWVPGNIVVRPNERVTWIDRDESPDPHTITVANKRALPGQNGEYLRLPGLRARGRAPRRSEQPGVGHRPPAGEPRAGRDEPAGRLARPGSRRADRRQGDGGGRSHDSLLLRHPSVDAGVDQGHAHRRGRPGPA